ncbi:hypothetical protein ACHAW5_002399 [Stephanodiscus triporus]|uniref:Uncharacterized protein n=1 Tax=Stephanodiscus triporus TaxID=2934178 RepID=A0ABD3NR52_9STRA
MALGDMPPSTSPSGACTLRTKLDEKATTVGPFMASMELYGEVKDAIHGRRGRLDGLLRRGWTGSGRLGGGGRLMMQEAVDATSSNEEDEGMGEILRWGVRTAAVACLDYQGKNDASEGGGIAARRTTPTSAVGDIRLPKCDEYDDCVRGGGADRDVGPSATAQESRTI